MILRPERLSTKREVWDHVAREFEYTCPSCSRRPDLDDSESYLVTGYCRKCQSEGLATPTFEHNVAEN